jgi:transcriptional regulator of heat shock response
VQQQVNEVKVHAQSESSQIKEAGSKLCQQIIKDVLKMWNDVLMSLRKVEELFHKDETDRLEELSKGAEAVDKWMDKLEMLKEEVTYVLNHTNANLLPKLKHFNHKVFPTNDKENIPITLGGLNKKSMKVFRDKVTSQQ